MPVTLQFVKDDHFYDSIISYVSHGWPTHVDVVVRADVISSLGITFHPDSTAAFYGLLGARPHGGVIIRNPGYSAFKKVARITLSATPEQEAAFYGFLKSQLGKPYDFADVFGFVTDVFVEPKDNEFCSMLALSAINAGSIFPQRPACREYAVDPWDLFMICSAFAPVQWIKQ